VPRIVSQSVSSLFCRNVRRRVPPLQTSELSFERARASIRLSYSRLLLLQCSHAEIPLANLGEPCMRDLGTRRPVSIARLLASALSCAWDVRRVVGFQCLSSPQLRPRTTTKCNPARYSPMTARPLPGQDWTESERERQYVVVWPREQRSAKDGHHRFGLRYGSRRAEITEATRVS